MGWHPVNPIRHELESGPKRPGQPQQGEERTSFSLFCVGHLYLFHQRQKDWRRSERQQWVGGDVNTAGEQLPDEQLMTTSGLKLQKD